MKIEDNNNHHQYYVTTKRIGSYFVTSFFLFVFFKKLQPFSEVQQYQQRSWGIMENKSSSTKNNNNNNNNNNNDNNIQQQEQREEQTTSTEQKNNNLSNPFDPLSTTKQKKNESSVAIESTRDGQLKVKLRYNWTDLEPLTEVGKMISDHQKKNCHLPYVNNRHREAYLPAAILGIGSDLHIYSNMLCHGIENGYRIRTLHPWSWVDEEACKTDNVYDTNIRTESSMACYFAKTELMCPNDLQTAMQTRKDVQSRKTVWGYYVHKGNYYSGGDCPTIDETIGRREFRRGAMEYLFTNVSPVLEQEAERQIQILFGQLGYVPTNLITVHIRWGDKQVEMSLVAIDTYIDAVKTILVERKSDINDPVHIFLASEDPNAVRMFTEAATALNWNVYVDVYYQELNQYHTDEFNNNPKMAKLLHGKPGLITLGSLLVAMEASDFVLTTLSNWSRLMNALRTNIIDPRCNNCTRMIDLSPFDDRR